MLKILSIMVLAGTALPWAAQARPWSPSDFVENGTADRASVARAAKQYPGYYPLPHPHVQGYIAKDGEPEIVGLMAAADCNHRIRKAECEYEAPICRWYEQLEHGDIDLPRLQRKHGLGCQFSTDAQE